MKTRPTTLPCPECGHRRDIRVTPLNFCGTIIEEYACGCGFVVGLGIPPQQPLPLFDYTYKTWNEMVLDVNTKRIAEEPFFRQLDRMND